MVNDVSAPREGAGRQAHSGTSAELRTYQSKLM